MPISLRAAKSAQEKNEVYKLRYKVFVEEEKRFEHPPDRIFDFYDTLDETANFLAFEGNEVVGSLRVTVENPVGLPAMEHYDFGPLMRQIPGKFAGIGWLCIAERYRRHRGILAGLFKMIVRETKKRGVRHLIAPLHPAILPLLKRFGARAVAEEFFSEELQVPMVPIHIDYEDLPPGLREFSQDPLHMIFQDSNERLIYRQGETIVEKGAPGDETFLIMRGSVEVLTNNKDGSDADIEDDDQKSNPLLGPGQVLGELALLDGGPRSATVICHSKEVDLMVWTREQFLHQLTTDNSKAIKLCEMLGNRLRMEVEGYSPSGVSDAIVATVMVDASRDGLESVNLVWLASQCGLWPKEMKSLIKKWVDKNLVRYDNEQALEICDLEGLKGMRIWK